MKTGHAGQTGIRVPDLDDPNTTLARNELIRRKSFLRKLYQEWYAMLLACAPPAGRPALEIGSGGGFLAETAEGIVSSDILSLPHLDIRLDGCDLPFKDESLRAVFLVNVFHHMARPASFLAEAERCLAPGGRVCMIEPWVSGWSRMIYSRLHYEPFDPGRARWEPEPGGPLSGGNNALPWIVFERDRHLFERRFPGFAMEKPVPMLPVSYILSGGVSCPASLPGFAYRTVRALEGLLGKAGAMFARIVLEKKNGLHDREPAA